MPARRPVRPCPPAAARLLAAVALVLLACCGVGAGPAGADAGPGYDTCEGALADADVVVGPAGSLPVLPAVPSTLAPGEVPDLPAGLGVELVRGYAIDVVLEPDGDARFHEVIDYDFGTAQRRGIYRDLVTRRRCDDRYDRRYPITDLAVTSPTGAPAPWAIESGETGERIRIGDPDVTVTGRHTYVIDYTLARVADPFADHVELHWNVIGTGWTSSVVDVRVAVAGPAPPLAADCFVGPEGSTARCGAVGVAADGSVGFAQGLLDPGEGMTVAVAYPSAAFDLGPPVLEERWSLARAFTPSAAALVGTVALGALLLGGLAVVGFRVGRDRRLVGSPVDAAFATAVDGGAPVPLVGARDPVPVELVPPEGVRPAQAALLVEERVDAHHVAATLVDLAVRGALRIEQVGADGDEDHRLERLAGGPSLLGYEQELLDRLFRGADEVLLSARARTFRNDFDVVVDRIYADSAERGWFAGRPDRVRQRWRRRGVLALLLSGAAGAALVAWTQLALLAVPAVVASLLLVVLAGRFPRRTPRGTGLASRVRGFRTFIEDSEAPRARWAEQRSIFTDYLPYAMAFGCTDRWADTFAPLGAEALAAGTTFYVGVDALDPVVLTRATTRFEASAATTLTSVPPSSSGSSGFSGGGFSGGGGGGGGGGSW